MAYVESVAGLVLDFTKPEERKRVSFTEGARVVRNTAYGVAGTLALISAAVEHGADTSLGHMTALTVAFCGASTLSLGAAFSGYCNLEHLGI